MSQSAVSTTLFSSPGHNGKTSSGTNTVAMPLANDKALVAMRTVATAVAQGAVSVEGIVSNALAAKTANFRKDGVMMLLAGLVKACGNPASIVFWLKSQATGVVLDPRHASFLLGELARELGLLDDERDGPYQLIQLVLMLRIFASTWEDECVRVQEIGLLLEHVMHNPQDQASHMLNNVRFDILQLASIKGTSSGEVFDDSLSRIDAQAEFLSVTKLKDLLTKLSPGSYKTTDHHSLAEHVISLSTGDSSGVCYTTEVKSVLCSAPSFAFLQKRLQAVFKASPSCYASLVEQLQVHLQKTLHPNQLREAIEASDLPLSRVEATMLTHILASSVDATSSATESVLALLDTLKAGVPIYEA
jgi:hypothetical protein